MSSSSGSSASSPSSPPSHPNFSGVWHYNHSNGLNEYLQACGFNEQTLQRAATAATRVKQRIIHEFGVFKLQVNDESEFTIYDIECESGLAADQSNKDENSVLASFCTGNFVRWSDDSLVLSSMFADVETVRELTSVDGVMMMRVTNKKAGVQCQTWFTRENQSDQTLSGASTVQSPIE
jgi:hypothetical protein